MNRKPMSITPESGRNSGGKFERSHGRWRRIQSSSCVIDEADRGKEFVIQRPECAPPSGLAIASLPQLCPPHETTSFVCEIHHGK